MDDETESIASETQGGPPDDGKGTLDLILRSVARLEVLDKEVKRHRDLLYFGWIALVLVAIGMVVDVLLARIWDKEDAKPPMVIVVPSPTLE